jgi:hypothetical protein
VTLLILAWFSLVGAGFYLLLGFEATPGPAGRLSPAWPGTSIKPASQRPTLLVFAHPRCPCTRATVEELALLMTHCQGRVEAHVLFYRPGGAEPGWERTDTWEAAARIPGVRVAVDPDGAQAARFAAETSGHAVLYGPDGRLWFSGGITDGRGHAGESGGRRAIMQLLTGEAHHAEGTPVYGCPLSAGPPPLP